VATAQLFGGLEPAIPCDVLSERSAECSWDMARLRVDRFLFAAITLAGSGVDQRHTAQRAHILEVQDLAGGGLCGEEVAGRDRDRFHLHRSTPGTDPAAEPCLGAVAAVAEPEPRPRRH